MIFLPHRHTNYESIIRYARMMGFGEIHHVFDKDTKLHGIIAIHSTKLGPAIGGVRCYPYTSPAPALIDALRLSYMMTLKAAISDLPHGGAKSVLLAPPKINDREAYFRRFGDFVHQMNGNYIAAVDVGTSSDDMNTIAERTPYVFGASRLRKLETDPSPHTALGVLRGIEAAVQFKLKRHSLDGVHIAIQGAGHVGYSLAKYCFERNAKITICDSNAEASARVAKECNATVVQNEKIYDVECDVFAPCALGGVINLETVHRLKTSIVAGAANNQLAHRKYGGMLSKKGILYVPDFIINSGGLIYAAIVYDYQDPVKADEKIMKLKETISELLERAATRNKTTVRTAEEMAHERLDVEPSESMLMAD